MMAQDKPYLQAKDPDATPRFREIIVKGGQAYECTNDNRLSQL